MTRPGPGLLLTFFGMAVAVAGTAEGGALLVAGSPTYDATSGTGFRYPVMPVTPGWSVSDSGTAVGRASKYEAAYKEGKTTTE